MRTQPRRRRGESRKRGPKTRFFRPTLEILEDRFLLSAPAWPDWLVAQPAQAAIATLDAAQTLNFSVNPGTGAPRLAAGADGTVVNHGSAGEVDWYSFTLTQASDVQLATFDTSGGSHLDSVVSLYNTEAFDPFYPLSFTSPPFDPQQHRLLTQFDDSLPVSPGYVDRQLAPGTYFVAVSGHGDQYFNPFFADSGYAGSTGDFRLLVTANALPIGPADGPAVLAVDSGLLNVPGLFTAQPVLNSSPVALYVDFSSPIDPGTVSLQQSLNDGSSVQLTYNPTGQFGNGNDIAVILNGSHYASDTMELQLQIAAPLGPGFYQLTLAGNSSSGNQVLTDPTDTIYLGQNSANPTGQDFAITFQIAGSEGTPGTTTVSDDSPATARNLGDITQGGLVQAVGAIGDDPAYNPINPAAPSLANPASQVDLYHFQISGPGLHDFGAEVFAGRIGSTLDAALSLFRVDASNTQSPMQLVASNDNSGNQTVSSNGLLEPLYTDPVLDAGLTAGDYYVAVSSSGNMPEDSGNPPGTNGVFDPNVSESGYNGNSTGNYVLSLLVQPAAPAPHVLATTPAAGATLTEAPTQLTVTFDSPVNLIALANQDDSGSSTSEPTISSVFIVEPDGQRVFPGLLSFDAATNQATFLMLDRLPNGVNQLHLSGANGLTGLGGNPLVGNDPSGDYVVSFTVADPAAPADPLNRTDDTLDNPTGAVQDLGIFFPREVQNGVTVTGTLAASASGDRYTIQLLEAQEYQFTLNGPPLVPGGPLTSLPGNLQMTITDATGTAVIPLPNGNSDIVLVNLNPGSYTIQISPSSGNTTVAIAYEILVTMLYTHENPPPLSVGATPVLQIRLASNPLPVGPNQGSTPVNLTGSVLDSTTGKVAAATGNPPSTQPSPDTLALSLRADLVGGVTSDTTGSLVVFSPPLQVQGLSNGLIIVAGNFSSLGVTAVSLFLVAPSLSGNELSQPAEAPIMESAWASWTEWLNSWRQWLALLPRSSSPSPRVPQPDEAQRVRIEQETIPASLTGEAARKSSQSSADLPDLGCPREEGKGSFGVVIVPSEGTTKETSEDVAGNLDTKENARNSLTWVGALCGTGLALLLIWKRTRHSTEPHEARQRRKAAFLDQTVKLANESILEEAPQ